MQNKSTASTRDSKKTIQMDVVGRKLSSGKPTPLDFDAFIPWICLQWQVPKLVEVTKIFQEKYKKNDRRSSSTRTKSAKSMKNKNEELESDATKILDTDTSTTVAPAPSLPNRISIEQLAHNLDAVSLNAIYDARGYLVEVAIINCPFIIHRKVIQAINLCVPFHAFLTKLVIRGHGATSILLHEIGKLLPHSNLTHVCLDDTGVPEGNYYVLLDQTSQLKCLSLNRCNIGDKACKELAVRIDFDGPAYSSLMVLELSSNFITDVGAESLGNTLKMNRRLLHLNLTGNKITDVGAKAILQHLMEFEITGSEVRHSVRRKESYIAEREIVLEKCIEEAIRQKIEVLSPNSTIKKSKSTKFKKSQLLNTVEDQSISELAEKMTTEIMGEFDDPFCTENVVKKKIKYFSMGNMVLCSLNLSYNQLEYPSIRMIADVLKYQSHIAKPERATGLLRIIIDGNLIPNSCEEYKAIYLHLNKMINDKLPVNLSSRRRSSSFTKK
ncbi:hypothetical protein O3G_MSEX010962 [Manduca sexta]|uniref:Leucine-rich repeat-containing protein 71 n=1 Tax=Manduca sexta TaxID=7130 RepID=A0A921ZIG7_MANSE|nr:hypothetical protein O3G_MSEX010962 [Manduca sexta]